MHDFPRVPSVLLRLCCLCLLAALGAGAAFAQDPAPQGPPQDGSKIEQIEIRGQADPTSVLPTKTPLAVFGGQRSVLETPRSVNVISELMLQDSGVSRILDLPRVSSSTVAPNTFGYAGVPTIRGQEGELFVNGMRRGAGNNGYGFPISFNPYESIAVVKGPPTAVYGPTQRVGGYLDLVTKKPSLERWTRSVAARYGMFDERGWVIDAGGPLDSSETLGVRFSYAGQNANSYYDFVHEDSHDLYGALSWLATPRLRLDFSGEYYHVDFSDNAGWNRPTQDLIDHGIYITGNPTTGPTPTLTSVIAPTGEVKLARSHVLTDPDDKSVAELFSGQLVANYELGPSSNLINRSLFQSLDKETVNGNSFREILKENYIAENRTEWQLGFDSALGENQLTTGVDLRWNHAVGFSQFNTEADSRVDLTADYRTRRLSRGIVEQLGTFVERDGLLFSPGASYAGGFSGNGDTNGSDAYQYGLFYQHDLRFNSQWSLLIGARGDLLHVKSKDPIPPPGQRAARDRITLGQGAANASLSFRPIESTLLYTTYSFSQSSPRGLGGGFALGGPDNNLAREVFQTDSHLYEAGLKWSGFGNTVFAAASAYRQLRNDRNRGGTNSGVKVNGAELELSYQPEPAFYVALNGSYIDARLDDSAAFQGTDRIEDAFDGSRPDIIAGTGDGSPLFTTYGPASFRYAGLPRYLASALVSYTHESGLGGSLNWVGMSKQNLDILGRTEIHAQFTLNAALFYRMKNYEFRVDIDNLTDQENFSGLFRNGFFGADLVMPEPPRTIRAWVRAKF